MRDDDNSNNNNKRSSLSILARRSIQQQLPQPHRISSDLFGSLSPLILSTSGEWYPVFKQGAAIRSVASNHKTQLSLNRGDIVALTAQNNNVYRGYLLSTLEEGIIDANDIKLIEEVEFVDDHDTNYVKLRNMELSNKHTPDEAFIFQENTLKSEILEVLKEWSIELKKLVQQNSKLEADLVRKRMSMLVNLKSRLMKLNKDDAQNLDDIRARAVRIIEEGSRLLNLEIIVRVPSGEHKGERANETNTSIVQLFKMHRAVQKNEEDTRERIKESRRRAGRSVSQINIFDSLLARRRATRADFSKEDVHLLSMPELDVVQLLLDVKACMFPIPGPGAAELCFGLYSVNRKRFITENFTIELTQADMLDERLWQSKKLRTVFTNIGREDLVSNLFLVCRVYRRGKIVHDSTNPNRGLECNYRRPWGTAVLDLSPSAIAENLMDEREYIPPEPLQLYRAPNETQCNAISDLINNLGSFVRVGHELCTGIEISLTMLMGELDDSTSSVDKENQRYKVKELLKSVSSRTQTISSSLSSWQELVPRNDFYITLDSGEFKDSRNVEICMKVLITYPNDTPFFKKCIIRNSNNIDEVSEYHSTLFYHSTTPTYLELLKLRLQPRELENAVLAFSFAHGSNKRSRREVFGVAFLPLQAEKGLIISNGNHTLPIIKYNKELDSSLYHKMKGDAGKNVSKNLFKVETQLVSTLISQDEHLNNFLRWENRLHPITNVLVMLAYVKMEEMLKFLKEVFDTLFVIQAKEPEVGFLVYESLLRVLGHLVDKRLFAKFKSTTIHKYISNYFKFTSVHGWLLDCLEKCLDQCIANSFNSTLRESMKCLDYLFAFIHASFINSTKGKDAEVNATALATFKDKVTRVMKKINALMTKTEPRHITYIQEETLKHMSSFWNHFGSIFTGEELGRVTKEFLDSVSFSRELKDRDKWTKGKMITLRKIAKGQPFVQRESRNIILPTMMYELEHHLDRSTDEMIDSIHILRNMLDILQTKTTSASDLKESLLVVVTVLPQLVACYHKVNAGKQDFQLIIDHLMEQPQLTPQSAKTVGDELKMVLEKKKKHEIALESLASCILCILYLMDDDLLADYLSLTGNAKSLRELMSLIRVLLADSPIPENWTTLSVLQFSVVLESCKLIASYLQRHFMFDDFNFDLWNELFLLLFEFITHERIQIEALPSVSKQAKITSKDGDMREIAIRLLWTIWQELEDHQTLFIDSFIEKALALTLIRKKEINVIAFNLYHSILHREYTIDLSLQRCETKTAEVLDKHVLSGACDDAYIENFVTSLEARFKDTPEMMEEGNQFLKHVVTLMKLVAAVERVSDDDEDEKTDALLRVMSYVLSVDREDLYIKYLHVLCRVHIHLKNYVEAGLTLLLHANRLSWTSDKKHDQLLKFREETEASRKENLYLKAIKYFEKGKDFERAIQHARQLVACFESEYAFHKIPMLMNMQANLFSKIVSTKRFYSEYFIVAYYGRGFERQDLVNKRYIYKAYELERILQFVDRVVKKYFPNAKMLKQFQEVTDEMKDSNEQYVQVMKVLPCMPNEDVSAFEIEPGPGPVVMSHHYRRNASSNANNSSGLLQQPHQQQQRSPKPKPRMVKDYEAHNNTNCFMYSRSYRVPNPTTQKLSDNEYKDLYTTTTYLYTKESFPGVVRRQEIIKTKEITLTPIQNACVNIEKKNEEIEEILAECSGPAVDQALVNKLSMTLNGTIDAAVNGGVKKYLDAFFTREYLEENPSDAKTLQRLKHALANQLEVLEAALARHRQKMSEGSKGLQEHLESVFRDMVEQLKDFL